MHGYAVGEHSHVLFICEFKVFWLRLRVSRPLQDVFHKHDYACSYLTIIWGDFSDLKSEKVEGCAKLKTDKC